MSKFFNRTQKVGEIPVERPVNPINALNVDELLETINRSVDDQLAGVATALPESNVAALQAASQTSSVGVVEFPTNGYRQVRIPRTPRRLYFPEDEVMPAPPALEAYRSFRTRLLRAQTRRPFRTLAVVSVAQADGKTLTSANLALVCSQLPQFPVLLIDGDLRTHGASRCLGHDENPGLSEVLSGQASREEAVVATDVPNLHFISAGDAMKPPPELFSGTRWAEFITWCREKFKLTIVDCPPAFGLADFELISASCEAILVIARARATSKKGLEKLLAQMDSHKLLGVALNDVRHYETSHYYYYGPRSK